MSRRSSNVTSEKMGNEIDPGAEEVENRPQIFSIDPDEERKVVRKLDAVIMPLMAVVYFFQYLDKQSINQAAIFGLREDLRLTGEQFSWAVSLFYLGQLCSEYPAAFLLSRLPIALYVGITIVIWGGVNMCLAAVHDFAGLAATRFFLGFTEGTVSPAFIIITSIWYKRNEHPIRVATWVSMNGVSQIIGALLMYGIGHGNLHLAAWRALFLICGALTSAVGLLFIFMMPRDTTTAWFLSPREREIATQRLAIDRATRYRAEFNKAQVREALMSPMTWIYCLIALCITWTTPIIKVGTTSCHPNKAYSRTCTDQKVSSQFNATVINGFGYSKFQTMLVGMPAGAVNTTTVWASALIPRWLPGTRVYTGIGLCIVPLLGAILLMTLPAQGAEWGIVVSTWLGGCSSALLSTGASIIASNVKGNTKKSIVSAAFFVSYCVGCIVSPQSWTQDDAPRYRKGCILSIAAMVCLILSFAGYVVIVRAKNKSRDVKADAGQSEYSANISWNNDQAGVDVNSDLTDVQDKGFRYTI
ncbi:putative transporter [Colletotrichum siamense]|nr:putative transporter [Colletotrichum siamense]